MATSAYILHKVMNAVKAHLATLTLADIPAGNIHAGLSGEKRSLPHVGVYCLDASPIEPFSGDWSASCTIQVRSDPDDSSEANHHDRCEAVFNAILDTTFAASITAALADFTAHQMVPAAQRFGAQDDHWVSEVDVSIKCCGSTIA
jgi:hypothetical protein